MATAEQKNKKQQLAYAIYGMTEDKAKEIVSKYLQRTDLSDDDKKIIRECFANIADADLKAEFIKQSSDEKIQELADLDARATELDECENNLINRKNRLDEQEKNLKDIQDKISLKEAALPIREAAYAESIRTQIQQDITTETKNAVEILKTTLRECRSEISKLKQENGDVEKYKQSASIATEEAKQLRKQNQELQDKYNQSLISKNDFSEKVDILRERIDDVTNKWGELAENAILNMTTQMDTLTAKIKSQTNEFNKAKSEFENMMAGSKEEIFEGLQCTQVPDVQEGYNALISNLNSFCRNFMIHAQKEDKLYYDMKTIATFVAGLNASRIMILEGISGTGKTSLPCAFARFLGDKTLTTVIPVQPSWKDKYDLLGFYNDFSHKFKETDFLKALYTALYDNQRIHIIMLDEMNLSRIEYYFADFLSVLELEQSDRYINLLPGGKSSDILKDVNDRAGKPGMGDAICIGKNIWFVGTANKDASTFDITDKVYDRASVLRLEKQGVKQDDLGNSTARICKVKYDTIANLFARVQNSDVSNTYNNVIELLEPWLQDCKIEIGNRIKNQMEIFVPTYCACMGNTYDDTVKEAIDIILRNKVLRKLDSMFIEEQKDKIRELAVALKEELGENSESYKFVNDKLTSIDNANNT